MEKLMEKTKVGELGECMIFNTLTITGEFKTKKVKKYTNEIYDKLSIRKMKEILKNNPEVTSDYQIIRIGQIRSDTCKKGAYRNCGYVLHLRYIGDLDYCYERSIAMTGWIKCWLDVKNVSLGVKII